MSWLWYVDRSTALVAYVALWFAVFTGVLYNARGFGVLHRTSRAVHVAGSVIASTTMLAHVAVGSVDLWLVLAARVPHPAYTDAWLLAGVGVGAAALLIVVTSVLGFVDARRFQRPWDPRTVHALAYGGFAFATLHAVAIGTDVGAYVGSAAVAATLFLVLVLALRFGSRADHAPG